MQGKTYEDMIEYIRKLGECLKGGRFIDTSLDISVQEPEEEPEQEEVEREISQKFTPLETLPYGKKKIDSAYTPRLVYFLDGSLRTKYLGDYIENNNSFPIMASEILCSVVEREGRALKPFKIEKRLVFIFPHKDTGVISISAYEKLEKLSKEWKNRNVRIHFLQKKDVDMSDIRTSMEIKAKYLMHLLEIEVAEKLPRGENRWLVMDGSIRKEEFLKLKSTIGLAKSFSKKPVFDMGDGKTFMITAYLSKLDEGERSAVFKKEDVAFWYIRLRNRPAVEPLEGLVKVDFKLDGDKLTPGTVGIIDEISAEIYDLRYPSVYPYPRWPSYIYPIRLAEQIMKSAYTSGEVIKLWASKLKEFIKEGR